MVHFNWFQLFVHYDWLPFFTSFVVSVVLISLGLIAVKQAGTSIEPASKFSIRGFFEVVLEFIGGIVESVIGPEGRKFTPAICCFFLFIFLNNVVGLIPGMTPATDQLSTTLAVGLFSFGLYNYYGIKEHGVAYLKQFLGPVTFLIPLFIIIEVISHLVRPMSLGLRLWGNMMGDHMVLSIFTDLAPALVPVAFYFLGLFVCFMQAFVFTTLTTVYLSLAISHDH